MLRGPVGPVPAVTPESDRPAGGRAAGGRLALRPHQRGVEPPPVPRASLGHDRAARAAAGIDAEDRPGPRGPSEKPVVIWLEFQDCAGQLRVHAPRLPPDRGRRRPRCRSRGSTTRRSWRQPAHQAEEDLEAIRTRSRPVHLIIEGAIPTAENGVYCTIGGRTAIQIAPGDGGEGGPHDRGRRVRLGRRLLAQGPTGAEGVGRDRRTQAPDQPRRLPAQQSRTRPP